MQKTYINENYSTYGITTDNTEGFSEEECDAMNEELFKRLKSNELSGLNDEERESNISEEILGGSKIMKNILNDIQELIPGNNLCEVTGMDRVQPEWYDGELADYESALKEWLS